MLKIYYLGHYSLRAQLTILVMFDLFVNLTLLNIIAVYSLPLSILIFKIITKNCNISLKLPIPGHQLNNRLSDSPKNFKTDGS